MDMVYLCFLSKETLSKLSVSHKRSKFSAKLSTDSEETDESVINMKEFFALLHVISLSDPHLDQAT